MKQLRKSIRVIALVLALMVLLPIGYGGYSLIRYGTRWRTSEYNTYLTSMKSGVTAGSIYDLQGVEIAFKQDSTLGWDDIDRLCKAADEKRYTLTNSEDTIRLKNLLFFRVKAEMDAYHDMSRAPESNTPEEIERQRARFCSVWQVLEEAELVDEYDAWKCAGGGAK